MSAESPLTVRGLRLPLGAPPQQLRALAASKLGIAESDILELRPVKVSIDARGKHPAKVYQVRVWTVGAEVPGDELPTPTLPARLRPLRAGSAPIIVGTGPAGLWAALRFVEAGQPCILLDRGPEVERRNLAVKTLRTDGELDPESNLCFGEGGAGTYSDGKLYTRVKHPAVRRIYEDLVAFGAPAEILVEAHPHVGTNFLIKLLRRLRAHLQAAGCELHFGARVTDLLVAADGACGGVRLASGQEIAGSCVVLATGHSARDVYELLHRRGVPLERKPFAVGARCEHPQELIDRIQYGLHAGLDDKVSGGGAFWSLADPSGQPDQVLAVPVTVEGDQLAGSGGTFDLPLSFGGGPLAMHDVKVAGTLQQGPSGFAIVDGQLGGVMGLEGLVTGLNTLSEQCPCLGLAAGQALFELKAEDKLGCTAALNGASPSCTAGDAAICSTIADNKGLFCTAIGIIKPDIDTDASGKADAFSIGLTFTSVPAAYLGLAEGAESTWGVDVFGGGCGGADGPATGAMALLALWVLARRRRLFGPVR